MTTDNAEVWNLTLKTAMGPQKIVAKIVRRGDVFTGAISGEMGAEDVTGVIAGDTLTWSVSLTKPLTIKLDFKATISGDSMTGTVKLGMFGNAPLTGTRQVS